VDGGILTITRREQPLVLVTQRVSYQRWVRDIFTGPGRGLPDILSRSGGLSRCLAWTFAQKHGLTPRHLPRDLGAEQWVEAFELRGRQPPRRRRRAVNPPGPF
jgi:23S rRNA (adenine-N6)-dimethyltransferase